MVKLSIKKILYREISCKCLFVCLSGVAHLYFLMGALRRKIVKQQMQVSAVLFPFEKVFITEEFDQDKTLYI